MAYKDFTAGSDLSSPNLATRNFTNLTIDGQHVDLPDASFVKDAHLGREGMDLVLEGPHGTVIVENYFTADPAPNLVAPDGSVLTPALVDSFTTGDARFAANNSANDESPIGLAQEVSGHATVTHKDGTVETLIKGTPIHEGDIVETDSAGAVNIVFVDQTSFAVSSDARLAIDKYVFDPATQSGSNDFSILKGMFVFTSGLIGRDDPDSVHIETPAGSIGIRGTIIAGNVTTGEITVVEGAIVLRDTSGHEVILANQYETARFDPAGGDIDTVGQLSAHDVAARFTSVSAVAPTLFSSINDSAQDGAGESEGESTGEVPAPEGEAPADAQGGEAPADMQAPQGEVLPPPPPPPMNSNPFGPASLGGMDPLMPPPPPPMGPPPPPPGTTGFMPPPPPPVGPPPPNGTLMPPPPPYDPNAGTNNAAPFHINNAPPEYFMAAEGMVWTYRFDKDFADPDFSKGDVLRYALDNTTVSQLNGLVNDGAGANLDILNPGLGQGIIGVNGDENMGWTFNPLNGEMILYFNSGFSTTPGTATTLNLAIKAIDNANVDSPLHVYNFSAIDPVSYASSAFGTFTNDNELVGSGTVATGTIASDNSTFIFTNANDTIAVDDISGGNTGSNNIINLGNGANTVNVINDAFDNKIIGGNNEDTFFLGTARVKAYGMDGSDIFKIDIAANPNILSELSTSSSNTLVDGGFNDFRAGHILRTVYGLNQATGSVMGGNDRGDTLEVLGGGTLDFTAIPTQNKLLDIERIDLVTSTATQNVTLHYSDIFDITSDRTRHTLVINVGNNDVLNLNGMTGMVKVLDDVLIDDNLTASGTTSDDTSYDVFSNGNVTVLIHNEGSGIVNFDGTAVTI